MSKERKSFKRLFGGGLFKTYKGYILFNYYFAPAFIIFGIIILILSIIVELILGRLDDINSLFLRLFAIASCIASFLYARAWGKKHMANMKKLEAELSD